MNMRLRLNPLALGCALLALAACGPKTDTSSTATPTTADAALAEEAVSNAADASAVTHPLCDAANFADVQAVIGGAIGKLDVIDASTLSSLSCVYLDTKDITNALVIEFITTERLATTGGQWANAAAYFAEWGRGGTPVAGLGDAAVWADLPSGLLVHKGNYALHFSSDKSDLTDAAVRAKFEGLAQKVLARLP